MFKTSSQRTLRFGAVNTFKLLLGFFHPGMFEHPNMFWMLKVAFLAYIGLSYAATMVVSNYYKRVKAETISSVINPSDVTLELLSNLCPKRNAFRNVLPGNYGWTHLSTL